MATQTVTVNIGQEQVTATTSIADLNDCYVLLDSVNNHVIRALSDDYVENWSGSASTLEVGGNVIGYVK